MPIRKLIDTYAESIKTKIADLKQELTALHEQREMLFGTGSRVNSFVNADGSALHGVVATGAPSKASHKAPRKPRVESGPRRTGLKADVLKYIMDADGDASITAISLALNARPQSVRASVDILVKGNKITVDETGLYHPIRSDVDMAA
jgi:hypothetical protein